MRNQHKRHPSRNEVPVTVIIRDGGKSEVIRRCEEAREADRLYWKLREGNPGYDFAIVTPNEAIDGFYRRCKKRWQL